jgi:tetratricopeptide (TPR) repeat protein
VAKKKRKSDPNQRGQAPSEFDLPPELAQRMMEGLLRELKQNLSGAVEGTGQTALEQAQELVALAIQSENRAKRVVTARRALEISPDCADAYLLLGDEAESLEEARGLYEQAVAAGERAIGKEQFQQSMGHFWGVLETRPYMRARLHLARLLWETGERERAVEHYREMLRLNPNDNQGIRYVLLSALMDLDRDNEAGGLLEQYADDASAEWAYTASLLAFRDEGDSEPARAMLQEAVETNKYVPEYLVGLRPLPPEPPETIGMGDEDEAISYVGQFLRAWRNTPGAIPWLRKSLKVAMPRSPKPRKPAWTQFRNSFLRLPQEADEVWQVDVCQLPLSAEELDMRRLPLAMLVVNCNEGAILSFDLRESKPPAGAVWNALVETLLRPRLGEPHRPGRIEVRRKTYWTAWRKKLAEIGIACELVEPLDTLDHLMESVTPPPGVLRRMAGVGEASPEADVDPAQLPQEFGETWQADVRKLPSWVEHEGQMERPWGVLVTNRDEQLILAQGIRVDPPPADWLWEHVLQAIRDPLVGDAHRPGFLEVRSEEFEESARARLEEIGVTCVVADGLDQIDAIFEQLAGHLSGGRPMPSLIEVPGMRPEQAGAFYRAAADFYRDAPWRRIPGDVPLKIECDKFQTRAWYAVVMGQSGMVLGLALYEDFETLAAILSSFASEEDNFRRTTGLSVMYGEAFEVPIPDLDAIEKYGWPVEGPEGYPFPVRVNPGRSVRPPLAWELELLEGCLRAVPRFLAEKTLSREMLVPVASGELRLRISRMDQR